jgi:dipeptidyl aminopeptidase/acylaminoacyl peptidase
MKSRLPRTISGAPASALFLLVVALVLAGCGAEPTPQVVMITATYTPETIFVVVTATFTAAPEGATAPEATATPPPQPTDAEQAPAVQAPTATLAPPSTDTPVPPPPTDTPLPPPTATPTPVPPPAATATPKPAAPPQANLNSYGVLYSNFDGGDENDENKYSVWVMRGDGSEARELIRPAIEPAFSANGKKVAYYRPFNGIWVYDLDKKSAAHVVASDYAEFASFSPEGDRLVFHEWVGNWWSADVNLYVVNADGSGRTQLPQGIRPAWQLKGDQLVFDSCRGTACGIFVVGSNGQGLRQVTSDGGGKASWSPDGKKIVYSGDATGNPEIMVVNADGSGKKQLTQNTGNDTLPVYSPDGQYIYFLSDQNGTAWAIRAMRADGSDLKTIRKVGVPPRWQFSRLFVGWW